MTMTMIMIIMIILITHNPNGSRRIFRESMRDMLWEVQSRLSKYLDPYVLIVIDPK